ncbi:DMT family transporter [Pseudooceanicola aestuarii]|uniref:DMT family transporter n=1 Tax=Pseudooceanicola aestuarii TaxID=2697319 RepID=UPI0013D31597|nr:DMT family transporter [Pseudooceanicola aestuarii]
MPAWIAFTLAAVVFQTARFMLQKTLARAALSAAGATFARFVFSAPLVWVALWALAPGLPQLGPEFWIYAMAGGAAQILATVLVVLLFKSRNFAVGVTLKKTEVLMAVLVGLLVLGEGVSPSALTAILLGLGGVLLLADPPQLNNGWRGWTRNRAAVYGIGSGVLFAISGVTYRGASLLVTGEGWYRALVTLTAVVTVQMITMILWLALREPGQITRVFRAWRIAGWVGLASLAGSFCWFSAFTLQNAAYVNAVGQAEVVLSLLAGALFFRERITRREGTGIALITVSVLVLIVVA